MSFFNVCLPFNQVVNDFFPLLVTEEAREEV